MSSIELIGTIPKRVALSGKYSTQIFNRRGKKLVTKGEVRHIHKLRFWKLEDVLKEKYRFSAHDSREIAEFMLPMLKIGPGHR